MNEIISVKLLRGMALLGGRGSRSITTMLPAGTTLKGLNILKEGKDPVAMPDDQYPPWLWKMLENDGKKVNWSQEEMLSIEYLRSLSKAKIMNFSLNKKT
jgi:large subunit ribosomal protein L54